MSLEWFRWYHGTFSDPKLALVAKKSKQSRANVVAVWAALLETASQANPRGDVSKFDVESVTVALDFDEEVIPDILVAMKDKGMIVDEKIASWEKRQVRREREDDSRERVAEHRKRKGSVTPGNANYSESNAKKSSVTPGNASVTPVTPIDTDEIRSEEIRSEETTTKDPVASAFAQTKSKKPKATSQGDDGFDPTTMTIPDCVPQQAWMDWCQHRLRIRSPMTENTANIILKHLQQAFDNGYDPQELIDEALLPKNKWERCVFKMHLTTQAPPKTKVIVDPNTPEPPYLDIVADYNTYCPDMVEVGFLSDTRKALIDLNWYQPIIKINGNPVLGPDIEKWKKLWPWIHTNCPFLSGKTGSNWRASLDWILNQENLMKIVEGKYTGTEVTQ